MKRLAPSDGKVLLVTETPPGTPNGFGVTLQCMFRDTPHKVLYTDAAFREHGDSNGFTFAQVPYHRSKKYLFSFIRGKIPEWRDHFSKKWLRENVIDKHSLVYAFIYSTNCLDYASWIAQQRNIPLFVHIADHSPSFEKEHITRILKESTRLICITDEMRIKYEYMLNRKDIKVLHNGAESICFDIPLPSKPPFNVKNPFILCFLGGLFEHLHGDCIEDVLEAIVILSKKFEWLRFDLYGQIQPKCFLSKDLCRPGITHHGIVMPLEKKYEIMAQANCFLIPSTFKINNNDNYRYSFPTKLPELIASGRPIISYGPEETATNRLLKKYKIGDLVNERSVNNILRSIIYTINNYEDILNNICTVNKYVSDSFSSERMRSDLFKTLNCS